MCLSFGIPQSPPAAATAPFNKGALEKARDVSHRKLLWGDFVRSKHVAALTPRAREMRKNMTPEEKHLWYDFLRGYPVRFLRQKIIDGYIVDFYCSSAKIAIELDGAQHYTQDGVEYDAERDKRLLAWGIEVVRFPNHAIRNQFEDVCQYIDQVIKAKMK